MKRHISYLVLVPAVMGLGLLAGSRIPQGGEAVQAQPYQEVKVAFPNPLAQPPLPVQPPKLRATLKGYTAVVFTAEGKTLASVHMEQDDPYSSNCAAKIKELKEALAHCTIIR